MHLSKATFGVLKVSLIKRAQSSERRLFNLAEHIGGIGAAGKGVMLRLLRPRLTDKGAAAIEVKRQALQGFIQKAGRHVQTLVPGVEQKVGGVSRQPLVFL